MTQPSYLGPPISDQQTIDQAASADLPIIDGLQAVAYARQTPSGGLAVNWYYLEDGTERVLDDEGNAAEWPA